MKFCTATISSLVAALFVTNAYCYTPGTCTVEQQGIGGPVPVTVVFGNDRIESISVGENHETNGIGSVAIEQLPGQIVEQQSLPDGVSGASVTSGAIFAAVTECVTKFGGDAEALKKAGSKSQAAPAEENLTADVIVVGAGAAGQTATIRAAELGNKVILLERQPFAGGAAAVNGGTIVLQGSKIQKDAGVLDDSPEIMANDYLINGHNLNDKRMLNIYVNKIGPTVDWATTYAEMPVDTKAGFTNEAEHSKPRVMRWVDGAPGATRALKAAVAKSGSKVLLGTPAESLIVENGKVVGVKAKDSKGTVYTIKAPAVILTTGGYGANKEMLSGALKDALYYGVKSSNGEGHKMAMAIGAKTQKMELGKIYPNGIEVAPGIAKSTIWSNKAAFEDNSGIMVNKAGDRVISELETNHNIKEEEVKQGGKLFILMDQPTFDAFNTKLSITGIKPEDIQKWLANDGKSAPIVVKGETIEEVASKAGVDGKELVATVKKYNGFVKDGKDADFNRPVKFMKTQISETGPYYIVEQQPRFATTMGGLVTDETMQVVDQNDKPIPGLFAAGEVVGAAMGDDSPPGGNMAWALTSGKYAAEMASESIKKQP